VYNDFNDADGLRRDCAFAKAMGYDGKTLIHPNQVVQCNTVFDPTEDEVAWSRKVITSVAMTEGGVTVCEGKMIEEMHARQARNVLRRADIAAQRATVTPRKSEAEIDEEASRLLHREELEKLGAMAVDDAGTETMSLGSLTEHTSRVMRGGSGTDFASTTQPTGGRTAPSKKRDAAAATSGEASEEPFDTEALECDESGAIREASAADREARAARQSGNRKVPTRMGQRDFRKVKDDEACDPVFETQRLRFR
jgi:hypothetical protein